MEPPLPVAAALATDGAAAPLARGTLVVWDFDHSYVNENSDIFVFEKDAPGLLARGRKLAASHQFTDLIAAVLRAAAVREGVSVEALKARQEEIPTFPECVQLAKELRAAGCRQLVLSDANTCFIDWITEAHGTRGCFQDVITNPAELCSTDAIDPAARAADAELFAPGGGGVPAAEAAEAAAAASSSCCRYQEAPQKAATFVKLQRYQPAARPHRCTVCPVNLCKGRALAAWLLRGRWLGGATGGEEEERRKEEEEETSSRASARAAAEPAPAGAAGAPAPAVAGAKTGTPPGTIVSGSSGTSSWDGGSDPYFPCPSSEWSSWRLPPGNDGARGPGPAGSQAGTPAEGGPAGGGEEAAAAPAAAAPDAAAPAAAAGRKCAPSPPSLPTTIVYIGDGGNDVCPVARLRGGGADLVCAREGYRLASRLQGLHEGAPVPHRRAEAEAEAEAEPAADGGKPTEAAGAGAGSAAPGSGQPPAAGPALAKEGISSKESVWETPVRAQVATWKDGAQLREAVRGFLEAKGVRLPVVAAGGTTPGPG